MPEFSRVAALVESAARIQATLAVGKEAGGLPRSDGRGHGEETPAMRAAPWFLRVRNQPPGPPFPPSAEGVCS
jgi:hypothetical protein